MAENAKQMASISSKPEDIKKLIIEAASQLYEKKGLHQTSVEEIATTAGISIPVTYHYVLRKSDIMLLIMEEFTKKFRGEALPEIQSLGDPRDKLRRAMEIFFKLVDENMVKVILVYRESRTLDKPGRKTIMAAEMEHVKVFQDILEEGIAKGVFKPVETDLVGHNIVVCGHTWALKHWHYKRRVDLAGYSRHQIDFVLRALSA